MSIASLALRTSAIQTLVGHTYAGVNVFDSAIRPLDELIDGAAVPVIVVQTDDSEGHPRGLDFLSAPRSLDLIIEMAVASFIKVTVDEGEDEIDIVIPQTDEGLEWTLDLMHRQVLLRLASDDVWPTLFRDFAMSCGKVISRRGANSKEGVRFAARQIVFTFEAALDPAPGGAPDAEDIYGRFLDAMKVTPGLALQEPLVRQVIRGNDLAPWRQAAALLGIGPATAGMIGLSAEETPPPSPGLVLEGVPAVGGEAALPPEDPGP